MGQPPRAEQWIKDGKNAVKWIRLSRHEFVDNQVRLQLFVLAYKETELPMMIAKRMSYGKCRVRSTRLNQSARSVFM